MKGVIFNILEDFVIENWGEDALDSIVDKCSLKTTEPFVGPKFYPDEDLVKIVSAACEATSLGLHDILRRFGRYSFPRLKSHCPVSLGHIKSAPELLSAVDKVIHVEVRKLSAEAEPPQFNFVKQEVGYNLRYSSERQLCPFVEGMLLAIGDAYVTNIRYNKIGCMSSGCDHCEYEVFFSARQEAV